jgi:hypothetical protein
MSVTKSYYTLAEFFLQKTNFSLFSHYMRLLITFYVERKEYAEAGVALQRIAEKSHEIEFASDTGTLQTVELYKEAIVAFTKARLWEKAININRVLKSFYSNDHLKYFS